MDLKSRVLLITAVVDLYLLAQFLIVRYGFLRSRVSESSAACTPELMSLASGARMRQLSILILSVIVFAVQSALSCHLPSAAAVLSLFGLAAFDAFVILIIEEETAVAAIRNTVRGKTGGTGSLAPLSPTLTGIGILILLFEVTAATYISVFT